MKLRDGSAIEIKEIYSATIPVDKKDGAFNWLRNNDLGDLLKMRSLFPLVVTKITRRVNTLTLPRVVGINLQQN